MVKEWRRGFERHFEHERQYSSFTNGVKDNKGIFIKYLRAHRLLSIPDSIDHL